MIPVCHPVGTDTENFVAAMPDAEELAVLAVFFNPGGYKSTVANFRRFHERLSAQGVRIRAAELAFGDDPFYVSDLEGVAEVRTRDILWQFERMVNHLISRLPPVCTKIAWLDSDILFENDQWHQETARALNLYPIVQPFRMGVWLDQRGSENRRAPGIVAAAARYPDLFTKPSKVHPGFAWAARREVVEKHGVPDFCILGGGDRVLANAIFGLVWPLEMAHYPPRLQTMIQMWGRRFHADVRGAAGWIDGTVYHLWHGDLVNRAYFTRNLPLVRESFDPSTDICIGQDGAWHWATQKPRLHAAVRDYFLGRKDDGDDLANSGKPSP